jgi:hypothetical protein
VVVLGEHREAVQHQHPQSVRIPTTIFQKMAFQWRRCVPSRTSTAPYRLAEGGASANRK